MSTTPVDPEVDTKVTPAKHAPDTEAYQEHPAREGHFVRIDLNNAKVKKAYAAANLVDGYTGDYGVWHSTNPDGTAQIRLRDNTNALVSGVPVDALRHAEAGGR